MPRGLDMSFPAGSWPALGLGWGGGGMLVRGSSGQEVFSGILLPGLLGLGCLLDSELGFFLFLHS